MKNYILLLIMSVIYTSCGGIDIVDIPEVKDPTPIVKEVIDTNKEVSDNIKNGTKETIDRADKIKEEAKNIIDILPPEVKPNIQPKVDIIHKNANEIKDIQKSMQAQSLKLDKVTALLESALVDITTINAQKVELMKQKGELVKQLAKEKDAKQKALFAKMIYLIITSIVLGALCIVSALRGETKAIWGAVVAGVVIILSLAISFYMTEFALIGFVAVVGGLALLAYNAYKTHIERKANKELVHTVEMAKDKLMTKDKEEIFGKHSLQGQSHMIQSNSTVKLVQAVRKQRKDDWEPIIKKA